LAQVGLAYQARAKPKAAVTPAIAQLAKDLTVNSNTPEDKVRALHQWVAQNIRYLGIYVGAGGFVPHDAQTILDNRYGDCKDHVTLLEALLTTVGIESSTALINSSAARLLPKLPSPEIFDHVITYIPSLDLYLDSTSPFAPMGRLPNGVLDKPVVLAATGQVSRTPPFDIAREHTEARVKMTLTPDGSIQGRSEAQMFGAFEVASRSSQFNYHNKNQAAVVNSLLSRFQETGTGEIQKTEPTNFEKPWKVVSHFELDPVVNVPGPSAMTIPVGLAPGRIKSMEGYVGPVERRFPRSCSSSKHEEWIELSFPKDMKIVRIPKGVNFANGPVQYSSTYELVGNVIMVNRVYEGSRKSSVCDGSEDLIFKAFTQVLRRDIRQQIFFE
jgi:hypothetical protein